MAQEYSRSDYLRALMTQKKSLAQQDNVLVNPSVAQAAGLDTSFQGVQAEPAPESKERNWWQRTIDTFTEIGSNVTEGVVGFFDSIGDALIYGAGAIGSLFGADTDWAKEAMLYDWNGYAVDAMQRVGSAPFFDILSGDIFTNEYWNTNGRERIAKQHEGSWVNEASDTFKDYYQSIEEGIGNVLPNIVLGILTGGTAAVVAGVGAAAAQGFGSGASEALSEGATYGQAGASGAISGAIEAGTELASAGIAKGASAALTKMTGKTVKIGSYIAGREVGEKITKLTAKKLAHEMIEEGAEEFVSEWLSPLAKAVYKGDEALKAYEVGSKEWRDTWHNSIVAFAGGAAGGALGAVVGTNLQIKMCGDPEATNLLTDISNNLEKGAELRISDNAVEADNVDADTAEKVKKLNKRLEWLKENKPSAYNQFLKAVANPSLAKDKAFKKLSVEEQVTYARQSLDARLTEDSLHRATNAIVDYIQGTGNEVTKKVKSISWVDDLDLQNMIASDNVKENLIKLKDGKDAGFIDRKTGNVYFSNFYKNEFAALIKHEAVSHGILDFDKVKREKLVKTLSKDTSFLEAEKKVLQDYQEEIAKELGKTNYTEEEARSTETFKSESLAFYLENHLSLNDLIKVLKANRIERLNLASILRKIKNKLALSKDTDNAKILKTIDQTIKELQKTDVDYEAVRNNFNGKMALAYKKTKSLKDAPLTKESFEKRLWFKQAVELTDTEYSMLEEAVSKALETKQLTKENGYGLITTYDTKKHRAITYFTKDLLEKRGDYSIKKVVVFEQIVDDYDLERQQKAARIWKGLTGSYGNGSVIKEYNARDFNSFRQYEEAQRALENSRRSQDGARNLEQSEGISKRKVTNKPSVLDSEDKKLISHLNVLEWEMFEDIKLSDFERQMLEEINQYASSDNTLFGRLISAYPLEKILKNFPKGTTDEEAIWSLLNASIKCEANGLTADFFNDDEALAKGLIQMATEEWDEPVKFEDISFKKGDTLVGNYTAGDNKSKIKVVPVAGGYDVYYNGERITEAKIGGETEEVVIGGKIQYQNNTGEVIQLKTKESVQKYLNDMKAKKVEYEKPAPKTNEVKGKKIDQTIEIKDANVDKKLAQADASFSKTTKYGRGKTVFYKEKAGGEMLEAKISRNKDKTYKVKIKNEAGEITEKSFNEWTEMRDFFEQYPLRSNDREDFNKKVLAEEGTKETNNVQKVEKEIKISKEKAAKAEQTKEIKEIIKLVNRPTADDYKNYAKAYNDTFVTAKSSNQVAELLSSFVAASADEKGVKISTKQVSDIGEKLFQNYNTLSGKELSVKLNSLLQEWLKTEVSYGEDGTITIGEVLAVDNLGEEARNKFVLEMANELADILKAKSEKTRYAKLKEFMRDRINAVAERVKYYKATSVELYNTAKRLERTNDRVDKLSLSKYGLNQLQVAYLKDATSVKLTPSHSKLGFAPQKVVDFVGKIGWFNKQDIENAFPWFMASDNALKAYQDLVDDINKDDNFLHHQVSLDNLERLSTVVREINRLSIVAKDEASAAKKRQISKAITEWKAVRTAGFKASDSPVVSFVSRVINDFASPYSILSGYFGKNSSIVDVLHTQVFETTSNRDRVKNQFKSKLNEIYAKNGINEKKLGKKITFTVHPTNGDVAPITAQLTIDELSHMYIVSQTEQGLATFLNGGYSYDNSPAYKDFHHMSEEDIASLKTIMEKEGMVQCCDEILEFVNKEIKQYKSNKDLELTGHENVMDRVYFPLNKQITDVKLDPDDFSNYRLDPSKWSNNRKNNFDTYYPIKGGKLTEVLDTYFDALATYGEMYEALNNVETLMRDMLKHNDADYYLPSLTRLLNFYAKQITGQDVDISGIGKGKVFSRIITATLFGNPSVVLKQTASAPTILNEVSVKSYLKAVFSLPSAVANYKGNKQLLAMRSGLLGTRWQTHDLIKGQTLSNTVSKVAEIMGVPMEKMDEAVIVTLGFKSAEFETKAEYPTIQSFNEKQINEAKAQLKEDGITDYTENDLYNKALEIETVKLTERIVARTQSNAMKTEMSMARAGAGGFIEKTVSFFTSDLQNKYSKAVALFREKAYAKKRIEAATALIEKTETQIKTAYSELETLEKDTDDILKKKAEIEDLERTLEEAKTMLAEAQEIYNNDAGRTKQFTKYMASLAMSAAMIVGIEQLIKRLFGRKGWDEKEEPEELAKAFLLEWTLFNIPAFETIYNMIDYDQEFTSLNLSLPNEMLSVVKSIWQAASEGKDWRKAIIPMIRTLSYATGFPFYNLYNVAMGFVKNFSPETGIKWDSAVRGYTSTYLTGAYKSAVENGGTKTAKNYLAVNMGMYKTGVASDTLLDELNTLYGQGFDVLPKNYMQSYTDESGSKVELTKEQVKTFKETYQLANTAVESLMNVTDYQNATPEIKSKLIKSLFDAYYNVAKARVTQKAEGLSKVEKLIYYSSNKINVAKYLPVLNAIKSIEATSTTSKKDLTIQYINKLKGFSRQEKLLLMYLNGYAVKDSSLTQLKNYLTSRGVIKAGIKDMFA